MYQRPKTQIVWPPFPPVTKALIIATCAIYFVTVGIQSPQGEIRMTTLLGMVPARFLNPDFLQVWGPITYIFMHASLGHLFFNMFGLWMFGSALEEYWGPKRYLRFYFLCGIGAGLVYPIISWGATTPLVGASGAIFGVLAAFGMLWPERKLLFMAVVPVKAKWVVVGFGVFSFIAMAGDNRTNIAHFAHLAGLLIGVGYVLALRKYYRKGKWNLPFSLKPKKRSNLRVVKEDRSGKPRWPPNDSTFH